MVKKKKKKKTIDDDLPYYEPITESTGFWIGVCVVIGIVLLILVAFWVKVIYNLNSLDYEGKNGDYDITKSRVGNVIFYHISVFVDEHEYIYSFRNHPKDLEDVPLENNLQAYLNRPNKTDVVYFTVDYGLSEMTRAGSVLAGISFSQILDGDFAIYNIPVRSGYTSYVRDEVPVVDCGNVSSSVAVIYMKLGNESKIYSENECIIIQGRGEEGIIRAGEKFAYYLLGVF